MLQSINNRWIINAILVLLLALVAYQFSLLVWGVINPVTAYISSPLQQTNQDSQAKQKTDKQMVMDIIKQQPFGLAANYAAPITQISKAIKAPETKLNYKLRGVYYSQNDSLSSAIIEIKTNDVQSFAINDEVEKGIVIQAIELKHIVLERYGKLEILSLEDTKFNKDKSLNIVSKESSNSEYNQLLQNYKSRFVNNPMTLARKFRSIPVTENGKNIGFRLKALRGETLLKKLNIPDNAIFTSINGVGLDKPFQALGALKALQTAKNLTVTYLLNGVEQSRNFEL